MERGGGGWEATRPHVPCVVSSSNFGLAQPRFWYHLLAGFVTQVCITTPLTLDIEEEEIRARTETHLNGTAELPLLQQATSFI